MTRLALSSVAGVAVLLALLEIVFRILPVSTSTATDYYVDPLVKTPPPHHRWTAATGWDLRNAQTLEANNAGFVATREFVAAPNAVALIGDSFIESSMLAAEDRPERQLQREIGSRPVYAMGVPGTALLDYAERVRFAHQKFGIRDFVILMERGDVLQSLCGSGNVHAQCLDRATLMPRIDKAEPANWTKQVLRNSALAQYLVSQLRVDSQTLWSRVIIQARPAVATEPLAEPIANKGPIARSASAEVAVDVITKTFFERVKPFVEGRLLIVVDGNRKAIYADRPAQDPLLDRFIGLARDSGATVVDLEPVFRLHWRRSGLKLDVGPSDGHLNVLGVGLMAQAVARELNQR